MGITGSKNVAASSLKYPPIMHHIIQPFGSFIQRLLETMHKSSILGAERRLKFLIFLKHLYFYLRHCTLWKADRSPASRAVMMALDSLSLSITEVDLNMDKGEHRAPEIVVMNPLQTLPILKDRELVIHDSHAINAYLATRYCNSGRLLPKDPGGRALVDQLLHYNSSILYPRFRAASNPILYENCNFVMPQQVSDIESSYADLENMLSGRNWFGGCWPTLADISLGATVSTLNILVRIDKLRYPHISSWLYRLSEEIFYITANKKGLQEFSRRIDRGCITDDKEFKCSSSLRRRSLAGTVENSK